MARAPARAAILMLGAACLAAHGCAGQPTSPTVRAPSYGWSVDGWVVSVDPNARTFTLLGPPEGGPYALVAAGQAEYRGDGIFTFDQLVAAYRLGMTLHVIVRCPTQTVQPYRPSLVEVYTGAPVPVTFHKPVGGVDVTRAPRLMSPRYHDASVFILPWTEFRQDGDYTSWDAVLAATGVSLCMAGEGYQVQLYAIHATKICVWRRTGENDSCAGK